MSQRLLHLLCSLLLLIAALPTASHGQAPAKPPSKTTPKAVPPKSPNAPQSPQSTHYPILLLGHGNDPTWSVLIGQKGPERFDRANYPPMVLESVNVSGEGADAWVYHAKDSATSADVTIHLARTACEYTGAPAEVPDSSAKAQTPNKPASATPSIPAKNAFRISLEHAQVGTFNGCARIAAELFPKIVNQSEADDTDDTDKKKPPVTTITNFKSPAATAYLNAAGKIVVGRGAAKKVVPAAGTDLALSHDGKKLLYLRNDSKMGSERTIVLYDFDSGRSTDLLQGTVRQPFWSPDDARVACLQSLDQKWRVVTFPPNASSSATPIYTGSIASLHGWVDNHLLLGSDAQNLYWIGDDRPQQTVSLKDIYGDAFRISDTDNIRINPINPDLLLVSAKYAAPPANSPDASGVFLYEIRGKRRVVLTPPDQWANHGEWSRDGIQVLYTRRVSATSSATFRVFWDGSAPRRYQDGTDLVVGQ
jgi:hypothetical protein